MDSSHHQLIQVDYQQYSHDNKIMKNRRSSHGNAFIPHFDSPNEGLYQKKKSEEQAKNNLFELSNELFYQKAEDEEEIFQRRMQLGSVSSQFNKRIHRASSKKDSSIVPKTEQTSPERQSPNNRLNQTLQLRRASTTGIDNGYRKKLLDIVESLNITELEPKACFNYSCYVVIDKRPPKKEQDKDRGKSYRSYSIRRGKCYEKSRDKKLMLLENSLLYKGSNFRQTCRDKEYYGFQKTIRL